MSMADLEKASDPIKPIMDQLALRATHASIILSGMNAFLESPHVSVEAKIMLGNLIETAARERGLRMGDLCAG